MTFWKNSLSHDFPLLLQGTEGTVLGLKAKHVFIVFMVSGSAAVIACLRSVVFPSATRRPFSLQVRLMQSRRGEVLTFCLLFICALLTLCDSSSIKSQLTSEFKGRLNFIFVYQGWAGSMGKKHVFPCVSHLQIIFYFFLYSFLLLLQCVEFKHVYSPKLHAPDSSRR